MVCARVRVCVCELVLSEYSGRVYLNVPHARVSNQVNVKKKSAKPRSSLGECEQMMFDPIPII